MEKRIVSLVVAVLLSVVTAVSAFATSEFQLSAFQGIDDYIIETDEMTGEAQVSVKSLRDNGFIDFENALVNIDAMVFTYPDVDMFMLGFSYFGNNWENIDQIIVKVGNKSYFFSNISVYAKNQRILDNNMVQESLAIYVDSNSKSFIQDLIEHRSEEIKIRLVGMYHNFDFELTQKMKDGIIGLYDHYVMAGGTNEGNLKNIANANLSKMEVKDVAFQ